MELDCVAQIRKLSGGRYLVTLEGGSSFPLYGGELSERHIKEGEEVPGAVLDQIFGELLPKRARLRAMHLLEQMDRTEAQLREKLRQSFYPDEVVEDAIGYVKAFHYIDALRYARSYLENHSAEKSMRQMEQELIAKGIDRETVSQAAEEVELPDEEAQILGLLAKKHYDPASADRKEQQRMYAYLMRRGYSSWAIMRAMRQTQCE